MTLLDDIGFVIFGIVGISVGVIVLALGLIFAIYVSTLITPNQIVHTIIFIPMAFLVFMGVVMGVIYIIER